MFMASTVQCRQDLGLVLQRLAPTQGLKDTNYIHFPSLDSTPVQTRQAVLLNVSKTWSKCATASSELQVWGKELNTTSCPLYPRHVWTVTREVIKDFGSCSLLRNLYSLGSRFSFREAKKFNNSTIEEGKQCVGNESPPQVVNQIHRGPGSDQIFHWPIYREWWRAVWLTKKIKKS